MSTENTPNLEAVTKPTLEVVSVSITPAQAKAIRILARSSSKESASKLADNLFSQVVRGRFKAKLDKAAEEFAAKWDGAAQFVGAGKMPMQRKEFIEKSVQELYDVLKQL